MKNDEFNVVKITNEQDGFASNEFGLTQSGEFSFTATNNFRAAPKDEMNDNPTSNDENASKEQRRRQDENPEKNVEELLEGEISGGEASTSAAGNVGATSTSASSATSAASSAASAVAATAAAVIVAVPTIVAVSAAIFLSTKLIDKSYTPSSDNIIFNVNMEIDEKDDRVFRVFLRKTEFEINYKFQSYLLKNGENNGMFSNLKSDTDYDLMVYGYSPSVIGEVDPDTGEVVVETDYKEFTTLPLNGEVFAPKETVRTLGNPYDNLVTFTYDAKVDFDTGNTSITINEVLSEDVTGIMVMFDRGTDHEGTYNLGDRPGTYEFNVREVNPDMDLLSLHTVCLAYYIGEDYDHVYHTDSIEVMFSNVPQPVVPEIRSFYLSDRIDFSEGEIYIGTALTTFMVDYTDNEDAISDVVLHLFTDDASASYNYTYPITLPNEENNKAYGAINLIQDETSGSQITLDILQNNSFTVVLKYNVTYDNAVVEESLDCGTVTFTSEEVTSFDFATESYFINNGAQIRIPSTFTYSGFNNYLLQSITVDLVDASSGTKYHASLDSLPLSGQSTDVKFSSFDIPSDLEALKAGVFDVTINYAHRMFTFRYESPLLENPSIIGAYVDPVITRDDYYQNKVTVTLDYLDSIALYSDFKITFKDYTVLTDNNPTVFGPYSLEKTTEPQKVQIDFESYSGEGYPAITDTFTYLVTYRDDVGVWDIGTESAQFTLQNANISLYPSTPGESGPEYYISPSRELESAIFSLTLTNKENSAENYTWTDLVVSDNATLDMSEARSSTHTDWDYIDKTYDYVLKVQYQEKEYVVDSGEHHLGSTVSTNGIKCGYLEKLSNTGAALAPYNLPIYLDYSDSSSNIDRLVFDLEPVTGTVDITEPVPYSEASTWPSTNLSSFVTIQTSQLPRASLWHSLDLANLFNGLVNDSAIAENDTIKISVYAVMTDTEATVLIGTDSFVFDTQTNHDQIYGTTGGTHDVDMTNYSASLLFSTTNTFGDVSSAEVYAQITLPQRTEDRDFYVKYEYDFSNKVYKLDFNYTYREDPNSMNGATPLADTELVDWIKYGLCATDKVEVTLWYRTNSADQFVRVNADSPAMPSFMQSI